MKPFKFLQKEIQHQERVVVTVTPFMYNPDTFERMRGIVYRDSEGNMTNETIQEGHPLWEEINERY